MKRLIVYIAAIGLTLFLFADGIWGQSVSRPAIDWENYPARLLLGEHSQIIYSSLDTVASNTDSVVTSWMQIGWASTGVTDSNRVYTQYNPETFTLLLNINVTATDDSAGLGSARFETAVDTTDDPIWNADSTNLFVADGNYTHAQYGIWMFEDITADSGSAEEERTYAYPLRVLHGGWIRIIFFGGVDGDSAIYDWSLICEH